jgi:hypothetical protein
MNIVPSAVINSRDYWTSDHTGYIDSNTINNRAGTLTINGEGADIVINGQSLAVLMQGLQEQLVLLVPHPELEKEWAELAEIRAQYQAKLLECQEKSQLWKALRKTY